MLSTPQYTLLNIYGIRTSQKKGFIRISDLFD